MHQTNRQLMEQHQAKLDADKKEFKQVVDERKIEENDYRVFEKSLKD